MKIVSLLIIVLTTSVGFGQAEVTLLHTSDIHGHFTNRSSPLRLGGVVRLKTQIDKIRAKTKHTLLLDSGDWSEGSLFYRLNSGEANHRVMEQMGFDAIVLGNHEWLAGAKELYESFQAAKFKVPVLGANLVMNKLDKSIPLENYIKPYYIKEIEGFKIGVLGLSTFDLIYDSFFEPVAIKEPSRVAKKYVKELREKHGCDVVILLTHLGIRQDQKIANTVDGIDIILGGHTHILLKDPVVVHGTPIVHIGKWAEYLGEYKLKLEKGKQAKLVSHKIHQIDRKVAKNPSINKAVEGYKKVLTKKYGPVFTDKVVYSEVDLPMHKSNVEDALANWAVDAIRKAGRADIAVDVGTYYRRDIFSGWSSTADFMNLFPHVYTKRKDKSWTVHTVEIKGGILKALVSAMVKFGMGVRISGASYQIDNSSLLNPVKRFRIGRERLEINKYYKVAMSGGVHHTFRSLNYMGLDLPMRKSRDTGKEAWREILKQVKKISPIGIKDTRWQGRVRSLQPDLAIPTEQIQVDKNSKSLKLKFQLLNAGYRKANVGQISVQLDTTPENTLDSHWRGKALNTKMFQLKGGRKLNYEWEFKISHLSPGIYPVWIEVEEDPNEFILENNKAITYIEITKKGVQKLQFEPWRSL